MDSNLRDLQLSTELLFHSIRPSILVRLGVSARALDLLDEDGVTGWQIGARRLLDEAEGLRSDSPWLAGLQAWLRRDLEAERARWRDPSTLIWQFRLALHCERPVSGDVEFFAVWQSNLEAAIRRCQHWGTSPTRSDANAIRRIRDDLRDQGRGTMVLRALGELAEGAHDLAPPPVGVRRLITRPECGILRTWLGVGHLQ
ncbi:MAG: hypothetical protein ACK5RL_01205 [Acidimicrobiales bacterium]